MFIPSWSYLLEQDSVIIERMFLISQLGTLAIILLMLSLSIFTKIQMRKVVPVGMLAFSFNTFLVALLPSFYSLIGLFIWIAISIKIRNANEIIRDEQNGIVSYNKKLREKEKEGFSLLSKEEQLAWLNERGEYKKVSILFIIILNVLPYIFGLYLISFI